MAEEMRTYCSRLPRSTTGPAMWFSAAVIDDWKPKNSASIRPMSVFVLRKGFIFIWLARSMSSRAWIVAGSWMATS